MSNLFSGKVKKNFKLSSTDFTQGVVKVKKKLPCQDNDDEHLNIGTDTGLSKQLRPRSDIADGSI